jgi:hypothetical protein
MAQRLHDQYRFLLAIDRLKNALSPPVLFSPEGRQARKTAVADSVTHPKTNS